MWIQIGKNAYFSQQCIYIFFIITIYLRSIYLLFLCNLSYDTKCCVQGGGGERELQFPDRGHIGGGDAPAARPYGRQVQFQLWYFYEMARKIDLIGNPAGYYLIECRSDD